METAGDETEIYLVQNANKMQKPRWSWLEREIDHIFRSGYHFSASFGVLMHDKNDEKMLLR